MWLYNFAKFICMTAFFCAFKLEYKGMENIPKSGAYIVLCNHRSNLDPILLAHKIKNRVRYMGKQELFNIPILGSALKYIGCFPVDRGSGDTEAIDTAKQVIVDGELLGMFPEGHRAKTCEPLRPKSGAALVAKLTSADVLPCSIYFEGGLTFRRKIVIRYGELMKFEELGLEGDNPRDLRNASKAMFSKTLELLEVSKNEY